MSLTGMTTQLKVSSTKGQNSSYNRDSFALKTKRERERQGTTHTIIRGNLHIKHQLGHLNFNHEGGENTINYQ